VIRFRLIFAVMAVLTILVILSPLALGLASAVFTYHGMCYGFTDGHWSCSWQEYASDQVFWSVFLVVPLGIYLFSTWLAALATLGLWIYQRRTQSPRGLPLWTLALIPIGGCLGGTCLISIIPVFIRFLYG
jgi:hypothetical protein